MHPIDPVVYPGARRCSCANLLAGPASRRLALLLLCSAATAVLLAAGASAQTLQPKRFVGGTGVNGCPPVPAFPEPTAEARRHAGNLLSEARNAVLVGERENALNLLTDASIFDPGSAEIAYMRARLLEEAADLPDAAVEYCRFLMLDGTSEDAGEVREWLSAFLGAGMVTLAGPVAEQFHYGVAYLDRNNPRVSVRAFSYVIDSEPSVAEAHFNRALAYLALRRANLAAYDLDRYLALVPNAPDTAEVRAQLQAIRANQRPRQPVPAVSDAVLAAGLVVPGLGQYATNRPVLGGAITLAAGGALVLALQSREVERTGQFVDPFDNPREYVYHDTERPYLTAGLTSFAVVAVLGVAEAYLYSRGRSDATPARRAADPTARRVAVWTAAAGSGVFVGARLSLP